jgi:hypothetical protein
MLQCCDCCRDIGVAALSPRYGVRFEAFEAACAVGEEPFVRARRIFPKKNFSTQREEWRGAPEPIRASVAPFLLPPGGVVGWGPCYWCVHEGRVR